MQSTVKGGRSGSAGVNESPTYSRLTDVEEIFNQDTIVHTGIRKVWTVHAAKIPMRNGQGRKGWGCCCPSFLSLLLGGLLLELAWPDTHQANVTISTRPVKKRSVTSGTSKYSRDI
jgi:hypothetical protein